jgi:hypothetical protein
MSVYEYVHVCILTSLPCVVYVYHVIEYVYVYVVRWVRAMGIVGITVCSRVCHSQPLRASECVVTLTSPACCISLIVFHYTMNAVHSRPPAYPDQWV